MNTDDSNIPLCDYDPDTEFFNEFSHHLNSCCNYYLEESFNKYIKKNGIVSGHFSLMHLNIRSLPANLNAFLSYMENIKHNFPVLGFTETRLQSTNIDCFDIDGYNHINIVKSEEHSKCHGISIFISNLLHTCLGKCSKLLYQWFNCFTKEGCQNCQWCSSTYSYKTSL